MQFPSNPPRGNFFFLHPNEIHSPIFILAANASISLIVYILAISAKSSSKLTPNCCTQPLATKIVLCLNYYLPFLFIILYNHFKPISLQFRGESINTHTLLFVDPLLHYPSKIQSTSLVVWNVPKHHPYSHSMWYLALLGKLQDFHIKKNLA